MRPKNAQIVEIVRETANVRTLRFDLDLDPVPGQYLMVWVRGVDEVPMSISHQNGITVQQVGEATKAIFDLEVGDSLGLRGPLGNGFTLTGKRILLVGGGVGAAPLALLGEEACERGMEVTALLGFRCCDDLLFRERFERIGELVITTDDGSEGICGRASAGLECLNLREFDQIYLCGPEPMMADVIGRCPGMETKIQASIDRYFKCGMGICGSCCIDPAGIRVCVEGPVIRADRLAGTEFGRYRRGPSGLIK